MQSMRHNYTYTFILLPMIAIWGILSTSKTLAADPSVKPEEDDKGIFSIIFENDVFNNTDRDYTNGVRLGWLSSEANAPEWVKWSANHFLPLAPDGEKRLSVA